MFLWCDHFAGDNLLQQSVSLLQVKDPLFKRMGASRLTQFAIDGKCCSFVVLFFLLVSLVLCRYDLLMIRNRYVVGLDNAISVFLLGTFLSW